MISGRHGFTKPFKLGAFVYFIPSLIYLCGIIYFISDISCLDSFPLDDAWIHRVYAQSFAFGRGFQYNPGTQEAGATSPLWVIVTSPAHWLEPFGTLPVVLAVKSIGIILGIVSLLVFQKMTERLTGSQPVALIAASLFALEPRFLFSSLSGMEAVLLIALWLGASYLFCTRRWWLSIVLFSMTPVTRPEALVILPLCILGLCLYGKQVVLLKRVIMAMLLWLPFFLWGLVCKLTTNHWLPNTFYLKAESFHLDQHAMIIAWRALSEHGYASLKIFVIGLGGYFLVYSRRKSYQTLLLTCAAPLMYLLGVVGTRRIILGAYYWTRWVDPAALLITATFCMGYGAILVGKIEVANWATPFPFRVLVIFFGIGLLLLSAPSFARSFQNRRDHLASDSRAIYLINVKAGLWINQHVPPHATVGVNDAGAIRYFGNRYTIDLVGLNNKEVAFRKKRAADFLYEADWLAIFPSGFKGNLSEIIRNHFEPQMVFHIPLEEYTICNCPGQNTKVIFKKKE